MLTSFRVYIDSGGVGTLRQRGEHLRNTVGRIENSQGHVMGHSSTLHHRRGRTRGRGRGVGAEGTHKCPVVVTAISAGLAQG
jgi:hypothetical protein